MNQIVQLEHFICVIFCFYCHNDIRDMLYMQYAVWIQHIIEFLLNIFCIFLYLLLNFTNTYQKNMLYFSVKK